MILPIRKILCTTDFSEAAEQGVKAADELARHFGAELYLVHVVAPLPTVPGGPAPTGFHIPSVLKEIKDAALKSLEQLIKREISMRVRIEPVVLAGDPAYEIAQAAADNRVDLIVMATHGQSGWKKIVAGSVTEKVVRVAPCAVLAVRKAD
jgi:nucleotide-binding universal stress UspA family protein